MKTDERREQLLRTGVELLGRRSYDEVSIDEIARAAGVSKGLLYHYFPTKKDFVVAVLHEATEELTALTAPDPALEPLAQLDASLDAFLGYVEEHAAAYATIFRTRGGGDPDIRAALERGREQRVAEVLAGIGAWGPDPARPPPRRRSRPRCADGSSSSRASCCAGSSSATSRARSCASCCAAPCSARSRPRARWIRR